MVFIKKKLGVRRNKSLYVLCKSGDRQRLKFYIYQSTLSNWNSMRSFRRIFSFPARCSSEEFDDQLVELLENR